MGILYAIALQDDRIKNDNQKVELVKQIMN